MNLSLKFNLAVKFKNRGVFLSLLYHLIIILLASHESGMYLYLEHVPTHVSFQ